MQQPLIDTLVDQKKGLEKVEPRLSSFFVDIEAAPFLPIGCFRHFHVFRKSQPFVTFLSSGSTNESRARHSFSKAGFDRYQKMSTSGFRLFLNSLGLKSDVPVVSLVPPPSEWPQSSLAAMIDMFRTEGLNIVYDYCSTSLISNQDGVIFGTSIHHLLALRNSVFDGKNVVVIDTGGTKGRTRNYSLSEIHAKIRRNYATSSSCRIVSEYGMCELSNQAWSLHEPHDGWFRANPGLTPLVIDLDKRKLVRDVGRTGFLAFIDEGNKDSFMGIITEDLAIMDPSRPDCFKLVGRAPDASQKGCSLNVKANFVETAELGGESTLESDPWDEHARADLALSLASIRAPANLEKTRNGQRIFMVLSANIPITFLYPTFMASYLGVKEVVIQLPSTRVNDPISERVRKQIKDLVEKIAPMVHPMQVRLLESRDVSFGSLESFDAVIVFGTDETLKTFEERMPKGVELIGLGSIQNAIGFEDRDPEDLADICSRWLGRGCLTPVALVADEKTDDASVAIFAEQFERNFSVRLEAAGAMSPFAHRHRLLEITGFCPDAIIYRGHSTFVVDLRSVKLDALTISAGGSGLVYVISPAQAKENKLSFYNPEPGFFDLHQGKLWSEWL